MQAGQARQLGSLAAWQPGSQAARQPRSQTARQPDSQTARQPGSQTARQPGSQAARQPDSQAARQPGSQAARQPGSQAAIPVRHIRLISQSPGRALWLMAQSASARAAVRFFRGRGALGQPPLFDRCPVQWRALARAPSLVGHQAGTRDFPDRTS